MAASPDRCSRACRQRAVRAVSSGPGGLVGDTLGSIWNFLLRTAEFTPLKHLYAESYGLSLRIVVRVLKRLPQIEAVLLRTSGPDYRFEPGLSDLDLTVIHTPATDAETIAFLEEFWNAYRRLKRWVPMLGEVEILTAGEFVRNVQLAPRLAKVQKTYVPLWISNTLSQKAAVEAAISAGQIEPAVAHVLAFVFTKYTTALLPRTLAVRAEPTLVHRKRFERQLATASSTLSEALAHLGVTGFEPAAGAGTDPLMRRAAQFYANLGRAASRLASDAFGPGDPTIAPQRVDVPAALEQFAVDVFGLVDVSLLWSRPVYFPDTLSMAVVTKDDLPAHEFVTIIDCVLRFRRDVPDRFKRALAGDVILRYFRVPGFPFMLPRSTFRWFGELSPFYFPSFSLSRRPSQSGGPLEMFAASRATCQREMLLHYRGLLSLKNDWLFVHTREDRLALYRAAIDYVNGYVSLSEGSGLAAKAERGPTTLPEAYGELRRSLQRLAQALGV